MASWSGNGISELAAPNQPMLLNSPLQSFNVEVWECTGYQRAPIPTLTSLWGAKGSATEGHFRTCCLTRLQIWCSCSVRILLVVHATSGSVNMHRSASSAVMRGHFQAWSLHQFNCWYGGVYSVCETTAGREKLNGAVWGVVLCSSSPPCPKNCTQTRTV